MIDQDKKPNKIFLWGMPGVGKSTLGALVAKSLGYSFYDTDDMISARQGMEVSEIFLKKGEEGFRALERALVEELVRLQDQKLVIACGGGTPCNPDVNALMRGEGLCVYLALSEEHLLERLTNVEGCERPLLKNMARFQIANWIRVNLDRRKKWYEMADYVLYTDGRSIGDTNHNLLRVIEQLED